jgi:hypothetical protein
VKVTESQISPLNNQFSHAQKKANGTVGIRIIRFLLGLRIETTFVSLQLSGENLIIYLQQHLLPHGLLDLRFFYLNRGFLICAFSKGSDTLRGRLQTLADLGSGKMMSEFTSARALVIEPRDSYVQHNFRIFRALLSDPEVVEDMRSVLADFPHALHSVISSSCFSS